LSGGIMKIRRLLLIPLALATLACRPPQPCGDGCDDAADGSSGDTSEDPDLPPPTDLPCGGADLMTDDLNCGACGNECYVQDTDTAVEGEWRGGGHCMNGQCGSVWAGCDSDQYPTCRTLLEPQGLECGTDCSAKTPGTTVLYFDVFETLGGTCWFDSYPIEYALGCDDPLPWNPDHNSELVACCAAQQP
jgi:hypothetical protein